MKVIHGELVTKKVKARFIQTKYMVVEVTSGGVFLASTRVHPLTKVRTPEFGLKLMFVSNENLKDFRLYWDNSTQVSYPLENYNNVVGLIKDNFFINY